MLLMTKFQSEENVRFVQSIVLKLTDINMSVNPRVQTKIGMI